MSRLPRPWTPVTMSSRIAVHTECAGIRMTDLRLDPQKRRRWTRFQRL
ncbi:hypothetical protein SLI_6109 [Streptomyces lividans 1326]|uniref:Uncharacterized protein n=1 Tax=Streptomyces lividans 1326 TaxID=1200984 RepID=A0A7U9HFL2_STRLI|nr:hypothetical protein SLI_6109 [Streptomyces lividans 1326]